MRCIQFPVDVEALIHLCGGFGEYFREHPEEEAAFPRCNPGKPFPPLADDRMFTGERTPLFDRLLDQLSIHVDSRYLEKEFYLTPPGEGKLYFYRSGENRNCLLFDFQIDPTVQIEVVSLILRYDAMLEPEITAIVRELQTINGYRFTPAAKGNFRWFLFRNRRRLVEPQKSKRP